MSPQFWKLGKVSVEKKLGTGTLHSSQIEIESQIFAGGKSENRFEIFYGVVIITIWIFVVVLIIFIVVQVLCLWQIALLLCGEINPAYRIQTVGHSLCSRLGQPVCSLPLPFLTGLLNWLTYERTDCCSQQVMATTQQAQASEFELLAGFECDDQNYY